MDLSTSITNLASLVIILTGIFGLIAWWRKPAHRLEAFVAWNSFKLPPQIEAEFADQAKSIKQTIEQFENEHPESEVGRQVYWHAHTLAQKIRHGIETRISSDLRFLHGCWFATVKNTGKTKCLDVDLRLPHAIRASVQLDGEAEPHLVDVTEVIHLGELRPKGECEIIAWTDRSLYNFNYGSVHVTHASGVGKIRAEWRTDRFSDIMGKVAKSLAVVPFIFALWIITFQLGSWMATRYLQHGSPTSSGPLNTNYSDFVTGFSKLDGRDREQEDYVTAAAGKDVTWDVPFGHASTETTAVFLSFAPESSGPPVQTASLPLNQRERIFALHHGDIIRIHGRLTKLSAKVLHVDATEFELLKQATTPSPSPQQTTLALTPSPSSPSPLRLDYKEFVAGFARLDGRDREQEAYIAAAAGKDVRWDVPFQHARTVSDGVYFDFGDGSTAPVDSGYVPASMADRIFAFHRGDVIRIWGRLTKIHSLALFVHVTNFELLRKATSPSPVPTTPQSRNK